MNTNRRLVMKEKDEDEYQNWKQESRCYKNSKYNIWEWHRLRTEEDINPRSNTGKIRKRWVTDDKGEDENWTQREEVRTGEKYNNDNGKANKKPSREMQGKMYYRKRYWR